ncbi:hypothetical protein ACFLY6_00590 [Candidatus Dependentiae bacterium]
MNWMQKTVRFGFFLTAATLFFGISSPLQTQFSATDELLKEATEISEKFKITSPEANTFKGKLLTLSKQTDMTEEQENRYRNLLEWGLYSGILKDSFVAAKESWKSEKEDLANAHTDLGVEVVLPETYEEWITYLEKNFRIHRDSNVAKTERLVAQDRLMTKKAFLDKLKELVAQRLDTLEVDDDGTGKTIALHAETRMEVVENSWNSLKALLGGVVYASAFYTSRKKAATIEDKLNLDIAFDERVSSLRRLNLSRKLDDVPLDDTKSFGARVSRLIAAITPNVTADKRAEAREQVKNFVVRNRNKLVDEDEMDDYEEYLAILEREVLSTEIFRDGELIALKYSQKGEEDKYLKIVPVDENDAAKGYTIEASGESLADAACHFAVSVTTAEKAVVLKTFLKGKNPEFIFSTDASGREIAQGAPDTTEYSLTAGTLSKFVERPSGDVHKFQPTVIEQKVALKSILENHGFLTLDNQKRGSTQNELTGRPSGIIIEDKLVPTRWGKFEVVRVADFYVDLSKIRFVEDSRERIARYSGVLQRIAEMPAPEGTEARMTFVKELDHFLEEQKTYELDVEGNAIANSTQWPSFIGTEALPGPYAEFLQLWETSRDYFSDHFMREPALRDALAELAISMETPPEVVEPHPDAPPDGFTVSIKSKLNEKYLQVVEVMDAGIPSYFLSATADDPIDPSTHLKVVAHKGKLGLASDMAQGMRLQVPEITTEETQWMTPEVQARRTRLSFAPGIISEAGGTVSFKSHENKREQFAMAYADLEKKLRGEYTLENLAFTDGFLTIDQQDYARVLSKDASGIATSREIKRSDQNFDIVPLMPLHIELGKVRGEVGAQEKTKRYTELVSYIESENDVSFLLYEVEKFLLEKKQTLESWQQFSTPTTIKEQMELLLTALEGIIPTDEIRKDFARLRGIWESPFVSRLEDGSTVVIKWRNPAGEEFLLKMEESEDDAGNPIYYLRAVGGDQFDSAVQFKVKVKPDAKMLLSSPHISQVRISEGMPEATLEEIWTLQVKDSITKESETGTQAPAQFVLGALDDPSVRFAMAGPELGAAFKNELTGGFVTVSTIDSRISTLEPLIGKRAGILRKETKEDGTVVEKLEPSSRETFEIVVLTELELLLTQLRDEPVDLPGAQRVVQTFLAASESVQTNEDRESVIREVERWVRFSRATDEATWKSIQDGISPTFEALVQNLKSIAPSARAQNRVQQISEVWTGVTGERIPTDGQSVGIRVNVGTVESPDYRYLLALQEEEMGEKVYYLGATAESPIGSDAQFQIIWQENKLGLVSPNSGNRILTVPVLAEDVTSWADVARKRGSRLSFAPPMKTSRGRDIRFADEQNLAAQILMTEIIESPDILDTFSFRSMLYDVTRNGYFRMDIDNGFIRVVDVTQSNLPPLPKDNATTFEFIRIEPFHQSLTQLRNQKDDIRRVQMYGELTVQVRGDDDIEWLISEVDNFITEKKESEEIWNSFVQNTALTKLLEELFTKLDESFGITARSDTDRVKIEFNGLKRNYITPFGEVLNDGARVVLKWTDRRGDSYYLRAIKETVNNIDLYHIKADGTDLLEAAASLDISVAEETGFTEFQSNWVKEILATGNLCKLQIRDSGNIRMPAEFVQYTTTSPKFQFIVEGSPAKASLRSRSVAEGGTGGYLSVGKVDKLLSTLDAATGRPAGMMRGDRLVPSSWETFQVIELSDFAKRLADLRTKEVSQRARLSGYLSAVESAQTDEDRSFLIGEVQHWVSETTSNWNEWSAIQADEELKAFADEVILGMASAATTAELQVIAAATAEDWQAGFMGEPHEEAPEAGTMVALLSAVQEKVYIDKTGKAVSDPNNAWKESIATVQTKAADNIDYTTVSSSSDYYFDNGQGLKCYWEMPKIGDYEDPTAVYGRHYKLVAVKRFLKAESNRGLGGTKCLRASWNPAENPNREDDPFGPEASFKTLIKGNRIGFFSEFGDSNNLGTFPIESTAGWILTKKYKHAHSSKQQILKPWETIQNTL